MYQLFANQTLNFHYAKQLIIIDGEINSKIDFLFLQVENFWLQIYLDENVLFIIKIKDLVSEAIDSYLLDLGITKKAIINFRQNIKLKSIFTPKNA